MDIDISDIPEHFYDPIHADLGPISEETENELLAEQEESMTAKTTEGDGNAEQLSAPGTSTETSAQNAKQIKTKSKRVPRMNIATKGKMRN